MGILSFCLTDESLRQCSAVQCTVLQSSDDCTALHCTALHCLKDSSVKQKDNITIQHHLAKVGSALYYNLLVIALHCTALHCTASKIHQLNKKTISLFNIILQRLGVHCITIF